MEDDDETRPRRSWAIDVALLVAIGLCAYGAWVARGSLEIERTHEIGSDATFDRALILLARVTAVVCVLLILFRRPVRQIWREARQGLADERRHGPDCDPW